MRLAIYQPNHIRLILSERNLRQLMQMVESGRIEDAKLHQEPNREAAAIIEIAVEPDEQHYKHRSPGPGLDRELALTGGS